MSCGRDSVGDRAKPFDCSKAHDIRHHPVRVGSFPTRSHLPIHTGLTGSRQWSPAPQLTDQKQPFDCATGLGNGSANSPLPIRPPLHRDKPDVTDERTNLPRQRRPLPPPQGKCCFIGERHFQEEREVQCEWSIGNWGARKTAGEACV